MTRLPYLVAALTASTAAACAPDPPCGLRICDIREAECQSMAAAAAACLRGVEPIAVPVAVVARQDFIAAAAATPLTPDQEESFRRWNAGLAALGLAPAENSAPANNAASAANVGGVYSWTDKQITVVDDGTPLDSVWWVDLLVHENAHAIQDARFNLLGLSDQHATDLDRALALGSVFEGEATYVEDLADLGFFDTSAGQVAWPSVFERWQASAREAARASPLPVTLSWAHFRYPFGTAFVKGALDARDWAGVEELFTSPPDGTREVEAGFGALEPAGGPWAIDLGDNAVPILGDRYDYVGTDRMGAWLFEVFLSRLHDYGNASRDLPPLLQGDALSIFRDRNTGSAVALWRLRLSRSDDAAWFALDSAVATLPAARTGRAYVDESNGDFVVVAASDEATLTAVPSSPPYQAMPSAATSAPPTFNRNWGCALTAR